MDINKLDDITKEQFNNLSEEEKDILSQVLQEYINSGISETLGDIYEEDFNEIPVDIITFIKDKRYLGNAWHLPNGDLKLFPYWEKRLTELFVDNISVACNNVILSGARGLGKSEIAVTIGLYLMYRLMCLKDPYTYLNLKSTEQVAFAFMNITEALAFDIGVTKFQNTVQASPWFMERGTMSGRTNPVWNPPPFIKIIVGSQSRHVIGQAIYFCLDGDTEIVTSDGIHKISDLEDKSINVYSVSDNLDIILSSECTVKKTAETVDEYELELEDGTIIKCTPNHKFLLKNGTYKEAKDLTLDDELFDSSL